ncbi:MAG: VOC family protein [Bryobacteraceae bacterium]|jgi:predicted enzyme related to lactoylglutathione lyase
MAYLDKIVPGSFCWMELATTDQNAAKAFYTSLFGWTASDSPMAPGEFYTMFRLEDRDVGAGYTMGKQEREHGAPPHWNLYIAVESADAAAARASELGGKVLAPAFDVFDAGRMAIIQDPTGAVFRVWQQGKQGGIVISNVNGAFCWADLNTPGVAAARAFYSALFGWKVEAGEKDPSGYLHIKNGDSFIGGIPPAEHRDPNAPPHWLLYFEVADCAASTAKATELGARSLLPPMSMEGVGWMSVIADPQGAVFALFTPARRG